MHVSDRDLYNADYSNVDMKCCNAMLQCLALPFVNLPLSRFAAKVLTFSAKVPEGNWHRRISDAGCLDLAEF